MTDKEDKVTSSAAVPAGIQPITDLKEYETQYFGFTPKSFIDGGKDFKL